MTPNVYQGPPCIKCHKPDHQLSHCKLVITLKLSGCPMCNTLDHNFGTGCPNPKARHKHAQWRYLVHDRNNTYPLDSDIPIKPLQLEYNSLMDFPADFGPWDEERCIEEASRQLRGPLTLWDQSLKTAFPALDMFKPTNPARVTEQDLSHIIDIISRNLEHTYRNLNAFIIGEEDGLSDPVGWCLGAVCYGLSNREDRSCWCGGNRCPRIVGTSDGYIQLHIKTEAPARLGHHR